MPDRTQHNLPSLVLKARHLGGFAFCDFYRLGVPEQALGGFPLALGLLLKINLLNFLLRSTGHQAMT